jgi:predicted metal-dependent hydrolase
MLNLKFGLRARTTDELFVVHQGRSFRVAIKRLESARRFTLRVRAATQDVVLTIPARSNQRDAEGFAHRHAEWIAHRMARLPERQLFVPDTEIPFRGATHILIHSAQPRPAASKAGPVWMDSSRQPAAICTSGDPSHFERRMTDFLRREARRDIEDAARRHAAKVGRAPISISLKDTTSRWGSCSAKGALNFSWRLILAPPFVLDYLVAHEMAHLRHHNHSDEFWSLTKILCPATAKAEAWLKLYGAQLHRYGRKGRGVSAE